MTEPVVKLATRDERYKKEVVARLRGLLKRAEAGEILSIAYTIEQPGNVVSHGGTYCKDQYLLIGYLSHQL